jgi:hypothetical protein
VPLSLDRSERPREKLRAVLEGLEVEIARSYAGIESTCK